MKSKLEKIMSLTDEQLREIDQAFAVEPDSEAEFEQISQEVGRLEHDIRKDTIRLAEITPKYRELCGEYTGHEFEDESYYMTCINCGDANPMRDYDPS